MTKLDALGEQHWVEMAQKANFKGKALANELRISRRQLQRYTQKLFGRRPRDWLKELRLALATSLLLELRSVKMVAFRFGFKQPSHFSREFKRYHGVSPRDYLAIHRILDRHAK